MKKIWLIFTALCLLGNTIQTMASAKVQYATLDWTVAETLLALGEAPVAMGDIAGYEKWVEQPSLPANLVDLGIRHQPNAEQLAWLSYQTKQHPLIFINTDFYAMATPTLAKFAQVKMVNFYQAGDAWQNIIQATQQIADLLGKPESAVQLLDHFSQTIQQLLPQAQSFQQRPVALVQFIDTRHLRIYAENSLLGAVLAQLGFRNAWQGQHNNWGFATIEISQLAELPTETRLVVIKPYPSNIVSALSHNTLWQKLDMANNSIVLPAIWTFGAIPSAQRFALAFIQALQSGGEEW